jgi:hypothetical protein
MDPIESLAYSFCCNAKDGPGSPASCLRESNCFHSLALLLVTEKFFQKYIAGVSCDMLVLDWRRCPAACVPMLCFIPSSPNHPFFWIMPSSLR